MVSICFFSSLFGEDSQFDSYFQMGWNHHWYIHFLKLAARTWKWMIGRRSFPFGARPIFRCELLVSGRVYLQAVFCISEQRWRGTYLDGALWCSWWRHRMKEDKHNRHDHMQCLTCIRIDVDRMMQNYTSIVRLNCSIMTRWLRHTYSNMPFSRVVLENPFLSIHSIWRQTLVWGLLSWRFCAQFPANSTNKIGERTGPSEVWCHASQVVTNSWLKLPKMEKPQGSHPPPPKKKKKHHKDLI